MFKFKDNTKAAGNIFTAAGAVTAIVAVVFFASTAWLAAIAVALIVIGSGLSLYSNAEFGQDAKPEGKTQQPSEEAVKEAKADAKKVTVVDSATATALQQPRGPQAQIAA